MKLKNILVPIDFSDCSNNALNNAIDLGLWSGAKLTLLNCYSALPPTEEVSIDLKPILTNKYQSLTENSFRLPRER